MDISHLLSYATSLSAWKTYPLIFFLTPFGGPVLILASGFLLHQHLLSFVPLVTAIALGEITQDILWYVLGYRYGNGFMMKFGKFIGVTPEAFEKTKKLFARYDTGILFVSKMTMGFFTMPIIVLSIAGAAKVPFGKYLFLNVFGEMIWLTLMLSVGYFLGTLDGYVTGAFQFLFVLTSGIAVLYILYHVITHIKKETFKDSGIESD